MRWDNLKIDGDDGTTLPGYRDPARVRTFDAPEALDTRFYEVRAKSAINKVPKQSQVPFSWTINPYRGCSHACNYCLRGDTPILMADQTHRPLADLKVGDHIAGTRMIGGKRCYDYTRVRDHWSSIKPAYRVTLADGTELVGSGDHRFLTTKGWKHVAAATNGPRRPTLAIGNRIVGSGKYAEQAEHTEDYMRGWMCGVARGSVAPPDGPPLRGVSAMEDWRRSWDFPVAVFGGRSRRATGAEVRAVDCDALALAHRDELIAWPLAPSKDWCKGFLAGTFGAGGYYAGEEVHVLAKDQEILGYVDSCLRRLGFSLTVEPPDDKFAFKRVVVKGALPEQFRLLHTIDPGERGKYRRFGGLPVASPADTRVASIEPLGQTMRLYDITTGTGDFMANGVVSHNCFARPTHKYLDMNAGRDFEKQIIVKVNAPEVVRAELAKASWKGEHIAMGTNTDPYQWVEGRYKLMPGIWEAMRDFRNPCSILSKSPLVLRDLPLLKEVAKVTTVTANFSVPTLDEGAWRATEPHTPSPRARLEAVAELNANGIPCGVLIAPLMPGINDDPKQVEKIIELATAAGAVGISGIALHLRGEVRTIFFDWLKSQRPDLLPMYERLYARGAYAPPEVRRRLHELARADGIGPRRYLRDVELRRAEIAAEEAARRAPKTALQTALF